MKACYVCYIQLHAHHFISINNWDRRNGSFNTLGQEVKSGYLEKQIMLLV